MQDRSHGSPLGHKGRSRSRKNTCRHNVGVRYCAGRCAPFLGLSVSRLKSELIDVILLGNLIGYFLLVHVRGLICLTNVKKMYGFSVIRDVENLIFFCSNEMELTILYLFKIIIFKKIFQL